jgi:hypothetical protein
MFDRHRGDRLTVTVSYDVGGGIDLALKDGDSRVAGRLEPSGEGTAPFESWWAETGGRRWRIDAEGWRNSWRFSVREDSADSVTASARRRRWRLGTYDIWMAPDRRFRLRSGSAFLGTTTLRDEMGGRVAIVDLAGGPERGDSVKIWRDGTSVPGLVLLLLLSVRLAMFEQASHVGLSGPAGP